MRWCLLNPLLLDLFYLVDQPVPQVTVDVMLSREVAVGLHFIELADQIEGLVKPTVHPMHPGRQPVISGRERVYLERCKR